MSYSLHLLCLTVLLGKDVWPGICVLLQTIEYLCRSIWLSESPLRDRVLFWWICLYSLLELFYFLLLISVFFMFGILITKCWGELLFWSSLLGILYASCSLIGNSFSRLGIFSSMLLLKIVYVPLTCVSSPSYIPNIFLDLFFHSVSDLLDVIFQGSFRINIFLVWCLPFFYHDFNAWDSHLFNSVWVSEVPVWVSKFFVFPGFPWFWFSLLILFSAPTLFYSFPSTICFCFLGFLLGFVRVLFKTSTIVVKAVLRS